MAGMFSHGLTKRVPDKFKRNAKVGYRILILGFWILDI